MGSIPGLGRYPEEGHGNHSSILAWRIPMDRGAQQATVHGITKSQTRCCCCYVASVVSNSVRPHRRQSTRLHHPWDFPGKNTGVGCHFLLQCKKVKRESEVAQSSQTIRDPIDCSLPGSSVHGIFQARVLEWGAIAFSGVRYDWVTKHSTTQHSPYWWG